MLGQLRCGIVLDSSASCVLGIWNDSCKKRIGQRLADPGGGCPCFRGHVTPPNPTSAPGYSIIFQINLPSNN